MSRKPVRLTGWMPPGHNNEESTVVERMMDLIDLDDPARGDILRTLVDLWLLEVELTEEMVQHAIRVGRKRFAIGEEAVARHRNGRPLSSATIAATERAIVYYMRIGNRVKIGFTTGLAERLRAIRPEELLAIEAGGYELEQRRHREFGHLRTHGEWFRLEAPLTDWIARLQHGDQSRVSA